MAEEGPRGASSLVSLPFLLLAPRWGARFFPTAGQVPAAAGGSADRALRKRPPSGFRPWFCC